MQREHTISKLNSLLHVELQVLCKVRFVLLLEGFSPDSLVFLDSAPISDFELVLFWWLITNWSDRIIERLWAAECKERDVSLADDYRIARRTVFNAINDCAQPWRVAFVQLVGCQIETWVEQHNSNISALGPSLADDLKKKPQIIHFPVETTRTGDAGVAPGERPLARKKAA